FLQKPTADGTQENLLDRLEDLIYETSMVANISDETFGSNTSGTALAYKLQSMSNLALSFDRKIEKSLKKRYKIWATLSTNTTDPDAWKTMEFVTSRNLPKNLLEEAQTAQYLEGIVSKDTQLSVLSIVRDTAKEVEKLEEEDSKLKSDPTMGGYFE
ncbi:MAG: phage portal protein, partial [Bacteroidales bacterium]|nr:phage portal protein [Bacteroidales bacterium]